jgi:hypothetical protein
MKGALPNDQGVPKSNLHLIGTTITTYNPIRCKYLLHRGAARAIRSKASNRNIRQGTRLGDARRIDSAHTWAYG